MKKKHKDNLLKLAAYLETLPDDYEQFNMHVFMALRVEDAGLYDRQWIVVDPDEVKRPHCGTVACAVGHGPSAGIRVYGDQSWRSYADRVFGPMDDDTFGYMFGPSWSRTDNTPKGAAARIRTYVTLGHTPDDWDYEDAMVLS
jgi:hypothetical protein